MLYESEKYGANEEIRQVGSSSGSLSSNTWKKSTDRESLSQRTKLLAYTGEPVRRIARVQSVSLITTSSGKSHSRLRSGSDWVYQHQVRQGTNRTSQSASIMPKREDLEGDHFISPRLGTHATSEGSSNSESDVKYPFQEASDTFRWTTGQQQKAET